MTHSLSCGDVVPGCATVLEGDSEDELLGKVTAHAKDDHGLTEIDDATLAQVKGAIRTT